LSETTWKKPRSANKFYPTEAQRQLLDVYNYKNILNPLGFDTVREVNQFVLEHAEYRIEFEKMHGDMSCPSMHPMSRLHWLFLTLTTSYIV